jgi:hypothetical protein
MGDYTPVNTDNGPFTLTASGTIVGGTLVTSSGNGTCAASTTGDHSIGVAEHDAVSGGRVSVFPLDGYQHEVLIQNTIVIAAGAPIIAGTTGFVNTGTLATVAAAGTLLGICTKGGTGDGTTVKARFIGVA